MDVVKVITKYTNMHKSFTNMIVFQHTMLLYKWQDHISMGTNIHKYGGNHISLESGLKLEKEK